MQWLEVILLGLLEGITEFLPISSTGHLIIATDFTRTNESFAALFSVFIQIGAVVAVVAFYFRPLTRDFVHIGRPSVRLLWLKLLIAFLPAAVLGLLLDDIIEQILFSPTVVALALIAGGVLFIVAEADFGSGSLLDRVNRPSHPQAGNAGNGQAMMTAVGSTAMSNPTVAGDAADDAIGGRSAVALQQMTLRQALWIGIWQTLALIPGMSRSGMSIIGGLMVGLDRRVATEFSFYLAIPTLGGATLYSPAASPR